MKAGALADILFVIILSFTVHASGLRVHVEYVDNHFTLRTQHIVREAVFHVSRLLSIQNKSRNPVFHVPREKNACVSVYFDGPNKGKCGQISKNYFGIEQCGEAKIPTAHLEGLQVFGPEEVEPLPISLPQGHGFTDGTNFVVYFTSKESKLCASSLAHSHVCRIEASRVGGVHSGRPVAGTINACWKEGETEDIMIKRVVIHELIHLLGMNYRSIREFIECEGKGNTRMCWKLKERVLWLTQDGEVVVWSRHFRKAIRHQKDCLDGSQCQPSSNSQSCPFQLCGLYSGMVLENLTRSVNMFGGVILAKSRTGVHWPEELFDNPMSVMIPTYVAAGHVIVDPLTLALLRTSGWYQINHTALLCMNHFLSSDSPKLNLKNLIENKRDFISQNGTFTGEQTTAQNSPSQSSPVNVSKNHDPVSTSEDVVRNEIQNSTTGLNTFIWAKRPSTDRVSENVRSVASLCFPLCTAVIIFQIVLLYSTLQGGGWARQDVEPSLPPPPQH